MNQTLLIIFFLSLVVLFHTVRSLLPAKVPLGRRYTRQIHTQYKEGAEVTLIVHPGVSLGMAPYPDPKTLLDACVQVLHSTRIADISFRDHRVYVPAVSPPKPKNHTIYVVPGYCLPFGISAFTAPIEGGLMTTVSWMATNTIVETGEPFVHEACQALFGAYSIRYMDDRRNEKSTFLKLQDCVQKGYQVLKTK